MRRSIWTLALLAACVSSRSATHPAEVHLRASRDSFEEGLALLNTRLLQRDFGSLTSEVWAEIKLTRKQTAEIALIGRKGVVCAEQAIDADPRSAAAHTYAALNLALVAVSKSKLQAFFEGLPLRIRGHLDRALELDGSAIAALHLQAKFLTLAPWPFRNRPRAERVLIAAELIAPQARGQLLLGDLYHLQGRRAPARTAWQRALSTPPAGPPLIDRQTRALARKRLRYYAYDVHHPVVLNR